jgi:hypothetical protein
MSSKKKSSRMSSADVSQSSQSGTVGEPSSPMRASLQTPYFSLIFPDENRAGMSYSDLSAMWWNWMFSPQPDNRQGERIMFLRGNMAVPYDPHITNTKSASLIGSIDMLTDPAYIYNRTGLLGMTVPKGTYLFFPLFDSMVVVGDKTEGRIIESTYDCRAIARKDFELASSVWANYRVLDGDAWTPSSSIFDRNKVPEEIASEYTVDEQDLRLFYSESSPFALTVSDKNIVKAEPESYLEPGTYEGVAVGIYLLIKMKTAGTYRFDFGGTSQTSYVTRSIYDISVTEIVQKTLLKDCSAQMQKLDFPIRKEPKTEEVPPQ